MAKQENDIDLTPTEDEQEQIDDILELVKDSFQERQDYYEQAQVWFDFAVGNKDGIFKGVDDGKRARYHIPLAASFVDAATAIINSPDIKFRYVPQVDQNNDDPEVDTNARMGTAAFDASRALIRFNDVLHNCAKETFILDKSYIQHFIDHAIIFPDPLPNLRNLNAWQVFHTPGISFNDACVSGSVVTVTWHQRNALKAQYPELSDEIDALGTFSDKKKEFVGKGRGVMFDGSIPWFTSMPGTGSGSDFADKNSVVVYERWEFDPSLKTYDKGADSRVIQEEHGMVMEAIRKGDPTLLPTTPDLLFENRQYHSTHVADHWRKVGDIRKQTMAMVSDTMMNPYDGVMSVGEKPVMDTPQRATAESAIVVLTEHIKLHEAAIEDLDSELEGKYPKYKGGWRHTVVLGEKLVAYDGYSKFYDYGLQGVPIKEFSIKRGLLNSQGVSFIGGIIDINRLLNSFVNAAKDNFNLFGSHQWAGTESVLGDSALQLHNDPFKPIKFPDTATFNMNLMRLQALPIPETVFPMFQTLLGFAEQTSGVFGSIRGQRQAGVRSGSHEQALMTANQRQFDYVSLLWANTLERLAVDHMKLLLAIPPPDKFVRRMIEGKLVKVDFEVLKRIDFTIHVDMNPVGQSTSEERNSIMLGIVQNLMAHPVIQQIGGISIVFGLMAEAFKNTVPDLSEAFAEFANKAQQAEQQQAAMRQQMAQQSAMMGAAGGPPQQPQQMQQGR